MMHANQGVDPPSSSLNSESPTLAFSAPWTPSLSLSSSIITQSSTTRRPSLQTITGSFFPSDVSLSAWDKLAYHIHRICRCLQRPPGPPSLQFSPAITPINIRHLSTPPNPSQPIRWILVDKPDFRILVGAQMQLKVSVEGHAYTFTGRVISTRKLYKDQVVFRVHGVNSSPDHEPPKLDLYAAFDADIVPLSIFAIHFLTSWALRKGPRIPMSDYHSPNILPSFFSTTPDSERASSSSSSPSVSPSRMSSCSSSLQADYEKLSRSELVAAPEGTQHI
ncbi:hypothetical protein NM688_g17 [Phlebia brevispora]|uniref:Uncharacterized protein n=1 Tax=Phlebia brevispora TaxID=194682 RepID=A0ACC1TFR5_9APHY|nr:hypothetical protein NM688_g17 [Phlebia brevispora]